MPCGLECGLTMLALTLANECLTNIYEVGAVMEKLRKACVLNYRNRVVVMYSDFSKVEFATILMLSFFILLTVEQTVLSAFKFVDIYLMYIDQFNISLLSI